MGDVQYKVSCGSSLRPLPSEIVEKILELYDTPSSPTHTPRRGVLYTTNEEDDGIRYYVISVDGGSIFQIELNTSLLDLICETGRFVTLHAWPFSYYNALMYIQSDTAPQPYIVSEDQTGRNVHALVNPLTRRFICVRAIFEVTRKTPDHLKEAIEQPESSQ